VIPDNLCFMVLVQRKNRKTIVRCHFETDVFCAISNRKLNRIDSGDRMEIQERPAHYRGPNLDPTGVKLYPRFLGRGAYALMANRMPRDNIGMIIGARGALVIDSGMNGGMARQIQDGFGNSAFGNYAFSDSGRNRGASKDSRQHERP
jgi:hypothetical protein